MGLDIFFAEDVRNALLAANEANAQTATVAVEAGGDVVVLRAHREGFRAALATIALAFGLRPRAILGSGEALTLKGMGVLLHHGREEGKAEIANEVRAEPSGVLVQSEG